MTPAERIAAAVARTKAKEQEERAAAKKALAAKQEKLRAFTRAVSTLPTKGKP